MIEHPLDGIDGSDPLGFLAALGVLVALSEDTDARLAWPESRAGRPVLRCLLPRIGLLERLAADPRGDVPVWLTSRAFPKVEKTGAKAFRGCFPPVAIFRAWVADVNGSADRMNALAGLSCPAPGVASQKPASPDDAKALGLDVGSGRGMEIASHQTPFDFTSRNAQFLDQVRLIGELLSVELVERQVFDGATVTADRRMGWDPWVNRPVALGGASVPPAAPVLEWFAFRALTLLPMVPRGRGGPRTTACEGRRKQGGFYWPLWADWLGRAEVSTLLDSIVGLATRGGEELRARGVHSVFRAELTKAADGYSGMFSPSSPVR